MCSVVLFFTLVLTTGQNLPSKFNLIDKPQAERVIQLFKHPEFIKKEFVPNGIKEAKDFEIVEESKPFDCKRGQ